MNSLFGLIVPLLVLLIVSAGCVSEDTPPPAPPVGGSEHQPGVLIDSNGDVTGQGVVLQGVPRGTLDTITFSVGLAPGVKNLDMSNATVVYADAVRTEFLTPVPGYRGDPPAGSWGILKTENEVGTPNMRLDYEERFVIRINPKAPVVPNQVITISVKPSEGKPLILRRVAPSNIATGENTLPAL